MCISLVGAGTDACGVLGLREKRRCTSFRVRICSHFGEEEIKSNEMSDINAE